MFVINTKFPCHTSYYCRTCLPDMERDSTFLNERNCSLRFRVSTSYSTYIRYSTCPFLNVVSHILTFKSHLFFLHFRHSGHTNLVVHSLITHDPGRPRKFRDTRCDKKRDSCYTVQNSFSYHTIFPGSCL